MIFFFDYLTTIFIFKSKKRYLFKVKFIDFIDKYKKNYK